MANYSAEVWVAPRETEKLGVEIRIDDEMIRITSRGALIGSWRFTDIELGRDGSNVTLNVEGEELVIETEDAQLWPALLSAGSSSDALGRHQSGRHESGRHKTSPSPRNSHGRGAHRADRPMLWKW